MAKSKPRGDASIVRIDILATYTCAKALLGGSSEDDAKVRGMVAAIMSAQTRMGILHHARDDHFRAEKGRAERKKKSSIRAESFDRRVADKMGDFLEDVFLPMMKKLMEAGLSYEEVKEAVGIPPRWGAKIGGEQFHETAAVTLRG